MKRSFEAETDDLIQVLRHRHVFAELAEEPLERRQLEERLGVSRATSHRYVRTLEELGFIVKVDGRYLLTDLGTDVAERVSTFETAVGARLKLAPMIATMDGVDPPVDIEAFEDATVTSVELGDPFAPLTRFFSLAQDATTLRGINTCSIAPTYLEEFKERILDGMQTELIDRPGIIEDIMKRYPEKCVQVCVSGNLTQWIHEERDALPFGLVHFDDCVGIGLFDGTKGTLSTFIDTDDPAAVEWATEVYDQYRSDSIQLDSSTVDGLQEALAQL